MITCKNPRCGKEVAYLVNGYCYECDKHEEEIKASLVYPLKIVSLLEKILEELKSIKNILGYLK